MQAQQSQLSDSVKIAVTKLLKKKKKIPQKKQHGLKCFHTPFVNMQSTKWEIQLKSHLL